MRRHPFILTLSGGEAKRRRLAYLPALVYVQNTGEAFANVEEGDLIDWIDPQTAEVKPVDGIRRR